MRHFISIQRCSPQPRQRSRGFAQCGEVYFETEVNAVQDIIRAVDEQTGKLAHGVTCALAVNVEQDHPADAKNGAADGRRSIWLQILEGGTDNAIDDHDRLCGCSPAVRSIRPRCMAATRASFCRRKALRQR